MSSPSSPSERTEPGVPVDIYDGMQHVLIQLYAVWHPELEGRYVCDASDFPDLMAMRTDLMWRLYEVTDAHEDDVDPFSISSRLDDIANREDDDEMHSKSTVLMLMMELRDRFPGWRDRPYTTLSGILRPIDWFQVCSRH